MLTFLGKLLLITGICFQAYLLCSSGTIAAVFNEKLGAALKACDCIPANIATHIAEHGKCVVAGLLASSALTLVFKCWCLKLPVILGQLVLLYINHQPFNKIPCIGNVEFWTQVAVIGGIIYLMEKECTGSCKKSAESQENSAPKPTNQETRKPKRA